MKSEELLDSVRENLNGRPGQPMVLGVCRTLAERISQEPWIVRAAAIVLALLWTGPALAAYVLLGVALPETGERTRGVFKGLFIWLQECVEKVLACCQAIFDRPAGGGGAPR